MNIFANKCNIAPVAVMAVMVLGIILELIGGLISGTTEIGFNTSFSPLMIVGAVFVAVGAIAHLPLKILSKKWDISRVLLDSEAILMIVALFFAAIFFVCVIVWPVAFPANG